MKREPIFSSEAELVACFSAEIERMNGLTHFKHPIWTLYHETAGWDLLAVDEQGTQVGIEAKLSLNAKVLEQALPGRWSDRPGPDFRAVLVPQDGLQAHLTRIAAHLGISIITVYQDGSGRRNGVRFNPSRLPDEDGYDWDLKDWFPWCPAERCKLPDYVPDVTGGHSAPVKLTQWKIAAIKLMIVLERQGCVTRADMKALQISPTRWTDHWHGFLVPGPDGGYVRCDRTPDLRAQHPTNWAQIEADFPEWSKGLPARLPLEAAA